MKISIITCFFNTEQYLQEAIDSVLQQSYKDWELLLVDDGSTDRTTAIAQENALNYPDKIFLLEHKNHQNKGLSASRNLAISQAKGELIAFLDADDVWLPEYLSIQTKILKQEEVSMVCEATEYWFSWKYKGYDDVIMPIGVEQDRIYTPPFLIQELYPLGIGNAPCVCGILVKKDVLQKYGGFDEAFTGMYEDQVFLSKFYLNEPIYISSGCNNLYRQRQDSLVGSSQLKVSYLTIRKNFLKWLQNYIDGFNLHYPIVDQMLLEALKPLPLVSIVITFLNEEKLLHEAVESVCNQDYSHWELLLIDDGSTDKSTSIAQDFTHRFPGKIFYYEHLNHENKGMSASRNLGVSKAKGELMAFLDADDIWLPQKLSTQVRLYMQHPNVGLIAESSLHWYSWNDPKCEDVLIPVGIIPDKVYQPFQLSYSLYPLGTGAAPGPCSWLLTKAAIEHVGGFEESFKKQFQLYEDQAFLAKIYLHEEVYISSACNNWYRQRQGSCVSWVKQKGFYDAVRKYFLEWLEIYLQKKGVKDLRLKHLLQKALFPYRYPLIYLITHKIPTKTRQLSKKITAEKLKHFVERKFNNIINA